MLDLDIQVVEYGWLYAYMPSLTCFLPLWLYVNVLLKRDQGIHWKGGWPDSTFRPINLFPVWENVCQRRKKIK